MFADQLFPAVAQTIAGLAVDIENGPMIVKQQEGVGRVIHKGTEAPLARAQLLLRLSQLRDVLQNAKLAQRPPRAAYQLTADGTELAGALRLLAHWGSRHTDQADSPRHLACGTPIEVRWYCPTCDRLVDGESPESPHPELHYV